MYLHIRLRPDGNGRLYINTPEELKKRFAAIRRRWYITNSVPFETVHSVGVGEAGSGYYIQNNESGMYHILRRGEHCPRPTGYGYDSFARAVNRLCKLMDDEAKD